MTGTEAHDPPESHPEPQQQVAVEGGFGYGVIGADLHVFADRGPVYLLQRYRPDPPPDTSWLLAQPSRMLNARYAIVGFTGRDLDLAELAAWRDSSQSRLSARWLHAAGGQGKSRLADAFALRSIEAEWKVITATHGPGSVLPPPGSHDLRLHDAKGVLLIVDYADRWPPSHLAWLFSNSLLHRRIPARLLLIARTASVWTAVRAGLDSYQAETSDQSLGPLPNEPGGRQLMFNAARDAFASRYGVADPAVIRPPDLLAHSDFGLTLAVHMAALVAVDAASCGERPPEDVAGLTTYLLDRERRHWTRMYENRAEGLEFTTRPTTMARAVFTAALTGPVGYRDGTGILTRLDPGGEVPQILIDHALCYPPAAHDSVTVLEPPYPDRLAEDYLALTLPGHDVSGYLPDPWTPDVPAALLVRTQPLPIFDRAPRAVIFLVAAAGRWPHVGIKHLFPLLRLEPALALRAGSGALTALAELPAVPIDLLDAIAACFPSGRSADLDMGMALVARRVAAHQLRATRDPGSRVDIRSDLAIRLSNAGLDREAVEVRQDSLPDMRHLAAVRPAEYEPVLAQTLVNLATALRQVGRPSEAIAAAKESMEILQRLAAGDPATHEGELAYAAHTLAVSLQHTRRRDEAPVALLRKAAEVYRRLAETDPQFQLLKLMAVLDDLGRYALDSGKREEAVSLTVESLEVARRLARSDPAAYGHEVARLLSNLSGMLFAAGQFKEAAKTAEESVAANRRLAAVNPAAYDYQLGLALDALAKGFWNVSRRDEALAASEEAIQVFRRLAAANIAREPNLASSLTNLGIYLVQIPGHYNEMLAATGEAVTIFRRLSGTGSVSYEHELAMALNVHALATEQAGHASTALAAADEGITIRRRLALANPAAYDFYLGAELFALAGMAERAGLRRKAKALLEESVGIARRLADSHPATASYLLTLAQGLLALARVSMAVPGEREKAREASVEAARLLAPLAEQQEELRSFLDEASEIRRSLDGPTRTQEQQSARRDASDEAQLSFRQAALGGAVRLRLSGASRAITVRLPPSARDGQVIRLRGHKNLGANGGSPSDLYVTIRVEPDDVFGRDGHNLEVRVPLTISEASLGTDIRVPLIDGQRMTLRIPQGTINGRTFRVPSQGLRRTDGTRSDLHIVVELTSDDVDALTLREALIVKATSAWQTYSSQQPDR